MGKNKRKPWYFCLAFCKTSRYLFRGAVRKDAHNTVLNCLPIILPVLFILSCAHPLEVIGTWQEPGKSSTLEFRKDGAFIAVDDMGMAVSGTYTLQANGNIAFRITHQDASVEIIKGTLTKRGDELIFATEGEKEILIYKKVAR